MHVYCTVARDRKELERQTSILKPGSGDSWKGRKVYCSQGQEIAGQADRYTVARERR
jgi:hypothetical protein